MSVPPSRTCARSRRTVCLPWAATGDSLLPQVSVAFDLATAGCAPPAFSLWAHRSTIAFFDAVGRELPEGLAGGHDVSGTSAMAAAYKEASGLAPIKVLGTLVEGGVKLNGSRCRGLLTCTRAA